MIREVFYQPTTIPAQPGFYVGSFCAASVENGVEYPAEFVVTPIIAWTVQAVCNNTSEIYEARGRRDGDELEVLQCTDVITLPVTVHGWDINLRWGDDVTYIKHPDGSFSKLGDMDTNYKDEAAALVGCAKEAVERKEQWLARVAEDLKHRDEVRAAAKTLAERLPNGREIALGIFAEHGATKVAKIPANDLGKVYKKIKAKTPAERSNGSA